jgi:hypothetical protein
LLCAGLNLPALAGTFRVPEEEPAATVQIPDDWQTLQRAEFLETKTPDDRCHLMLLPPEGNKIGESIGEAIRYIRRNGTITVRSGRPKEEKSKFNARDVTVMSWDASENGQPIVIRCYVLPIGRDDSFIAVVWGTSEAQTRYAKAMITVFESLVGMPGSRSE